MINSLQKFALFVFFLFVTGSSFSQSKTPDSLKVDIDVSNRYIWRGQPWGGDYVVVQPTVEYDFAEKWSVALWATTNFKKQYFYQDGITENKGYQEFDITLTYNIKDYLSVSLNDYYWPSVEKVE